MLAAYIEEFGPPEEIRFGELAPPRLGPCDVLVRVHAVAVNGIDAYIRSGAYPVRAAMPFIIGRDLVGTVVDTGPEVARFRAGDAVWANNQGYDGRQGSFSEYCAVGQDLLYPLPEGADPLQTVAVVHSALTAVLGLQHKARLEPGETVFINGGAGNVGTAALGIAKALGARVAVTAGQQDKAEWCLGLGADLVIDYRTRNVLDALREFAPEGVDVYFDTTRHFDGKLAVASVARRGRILVIAGLTGETLLPVGRFYQRNAAMYGFTVTGATTQELASYAGEINRWLAQGVVRARIAACLPLSQAAEAHRRLEAGGLFGKLVLTTEEVGHGDCREAG
ncbi:MAG: NADPH:quinone reductase [Bryobacterales bacterium]|nr:NADPH:quinone reductase [Bryobacterales bacterium]